MAIDTNKKSAKDYEKIIEEAISNNVETIYFNGFVNTLGIGDVMLLLQRNGKPVAILNASYTVAKTLAIKLGESISFLESKVNQKMLTTDQIKECVAGEKKDDK